MDARPDHLLESAREPFERATPCRAVHLRRELIAGGRDFTPR
jgi:hypothetical protein